jgi:exonuclease SbcC
MKDQLPILVQDIEHSILATTETQFNRYFKEWCRTLAEEENIDIEINPENFQPTIMINGFESPFNDMSGGQKSALSLAYRLALNKVINTKHQDVKTKDLLILDEPTDGFSEQQVNKMQEVFDKLNTKQMIIISHERMLDSFVQNIFTFKKVKHQTKVKQERLS